MSQAFFQESSAPRGGLRVKRFDALQPFALLALRAALALIFFTHGYPKLAGASSGGVQFFIQHGMPGWFFYLAGVLEVFGGVLLLLGLFTRPAAVLLSIEMAVAIWKVHFAKGYLAVHEYEFPLALCVACLALASVGPGLLSLDQPLFGNKSGASRNSKK